MELVILVGPPAMGTMAVGMELERVTGLRLFHNHDLAPDGVEVFGLPRPHPQPS